jgi:hypothetical protein
VNGRPPARTLQERLGNQATQALIARSIASREQERATDGPAAVSVTTPPSAQLSKATRLPAKVSKPNDPAELEAEETARKVMRMQEPPATKPTAQKGTAKGTLQRAEAAPSPAAVSVTTPPSVQLSRATRLPAKVSKPNDPAELEAEETARKVMRMQEPPATRPTSQKGTPKGTVQRAEVAPAPAPAAHASSPVNIAGGSPLPASVRSHMEPRFGANFGNVRVHTGESAAHQSASLDAHAFTVGEHVFFGKDKFQPQSAGGRELIAHELTHTIQQGAAVQRSEDTTVTRREPASVQRLGGLRGYIAEQANLIPGFRLFTIVLGLNPINMASVDRSAANILRALLELIPVTGALLAQALDNYGIFAKVGAWIESQIRSLGMVGSGFRRAVDEFISSLGLRDLNPFGFGALWERAKRIFTEPIDRLIAFGKALATDIIKFVREAILLPLAKWAEGTRGYDLLKAVLGEDPVTGQVVPRTPETLIGGFMKFIGQEEVWENIKKANAIPRAWKWFQEALVSLMGFVKQIPTLFMNTLKSLEIADLILVPNAIAKIAHVFGGFVVQFASWAGKAVWTLLELVFEVVSPGTLIYLKKTGAALMSILKNPLPFVRNLVRAAKLGFQNFADNFGGHLKAGLIDWLTGSLEGVYIPKALSLPELGKFAISVLGISWAQIRGKIVKALGPRGETIMKGLETAFDIVVALMKGGPAAAWELIKEKLSDLKDQVVSGIVGFVTDTVVKKAIPKLIAMFIPGAGFISAIISIYDTIMVFVEKISKIIQVVTAFIDSIVAIAGGNITAAAKRVENILGNLLSLAISFLAGFLGLGKITDKIKEIIEKVRATVDKAIDAAIAWIVDKAKKLFRSAKSAVKSLVSWWKREERFVVDGEKHRVFFQGNAKNAQVRVASDEKSLDDFLKEAKASGGDAKAIADAASAQAEIAKLRTTRNPPTPDAEDPTVDSQIEVQFTIIAGLLPKLFSGGTWGSDTNPLQLVYPKKSTSLYRTLYLGPSVLGKLNQEDLKARVSKSGPMVPGFDPKAPISPTVAALDKWVNSGGVITVYSPFTQAGWPYGASHGGSGMLGLAPQFQAQPGTSFDYNKGSTPGGRKLNDVLKKYGYYGRKDGGENSDGDHVLEAQLIGTTAADQIPNMWPLDKTENRHGENLEMNADVSVEGRPTLKFKGLLEASNSTDSKKTKRKNGLRVMIKSTK